jgi:hypothetical protein
MIYQQSNFITLPLPHSPFFVFGSGPVLELRPRQTRVLRVILDRVSADNSFLSDRYTAHTSTLLIYDESEKRVVKLINVSAQLCRSQMQLLERDKERSLIHVGSIGYSNGWERVRFVVHLQNLSDLECVFKVDDVKDITLLGMQSGGEDVAADEDDSIFDQAPSDVSQWTIPPRSPCTVKFVLQVAKSDPAGPRMWNLVFRNLRNPLNVLQCAVCCVVTTCPIRFERLATSSSPHLLRFPAISWSSLLSNVPQHSNFSIANVSSFPLLRIQLECQVTSQLNDILRLEANAPHAIHLRPHPLDHEDANHDGSHERLSSSPFVTNITDIITFDLTKEVSIGMLMCVTDPQALKNVLSRKADFKIGEIRVQMQSPQADDLLEGAEPHYHEWKEERIEVWGYVTNFSSFSVNPQQLVFVGSRSPHSPMTSTSTGDLLDRSLTPTVPGLQQQHTFVITNTSHTEEMTYSVGTDNGTDFVAGENEIDGNDHVSLSIDQPTGLLMPNTSVTITVTARVKLAFSGVIKLVVSDDSGEAVPQYVTLMFQQQPHTPMMKSIGGDIAPFDLREIKEDALLFVKGCKRRGESKTQYILDAGRRRKNEEPLVWELKLQVATSVDHSISYRVDTISSENAPWLMLTNFQGTVDPNESKVIRLTFSTQEVGFFSTYLVVDDGSGVLITIFVTYEVVMKAEDRTEKFFSVNMDDGEFLYNSCKPSLDASPDTPTAKAIDYGLAHAGQPIQNRSFVINNLATIPLNFSLSSACITGSKKSEINFALTSRSHTFFRDLTIPPRSSARVFVCFIPQTQSMSSNRFTMIADASVKWLEEHSILVSCRLVKDVSETITVRAVCLQPQISVWLEDCVFELAVDEAGMLDERGEMESYSEISNKGSNDSLWSKSLRIVPLEREIRVESTVRDSIRPKEEVDQINFTIKNNTLFFLHRRPHAILPSMVSAIDTSRIIVSPNIDAISQRWEVLSKYRYVEEHISIYNLNAIDQVFHVRLCLALGSERQFSVKMLGIQLSHMITVLESQTVEFLHSFSSALRRMSDKTAIHRQREDLVLQLNYLVDEMILICDSSSTPGAIMPLARLLFCTLFSHDAVFRSFAPRLFTSPALPVSNSTVATVTTQEDRATVLPWVLPFYRFVTRVTDTGSDNVHALRRMAEAMFDGVDIASLLK